MHLGTEILSGLLTQISWSKIIVSSQVNWSDWWCLIIVCFSCLGIYWLGNCHELLVIFVKCLAVFRPSVGIFLIALPVQLPKILAFVECRNSGRRKYSSHLKKMTPEFYLQSNKSCWQFVFSVSQGNIGKYIIKNSLE